MTAELVRRRVAVIAAGAPPAAVAAKAATSTIPIVFVVGFDPIEAKLVGSYNRPGGNVTGVHLITSPLGQKRLELILELVPKARTPSRWAPDGGPAGCADEVTLARNGAKSREIGRAHV